MVLGPLIGVYGPHLTVYDDALHRRRDPAEAPWSPFGDQLFPISSYAASAMALVRAKGKVNALPVLAVVFLLLICEVRAPRLAAYALFAPSKPVIPIER